MSVCTLCRLALPACSRVPAYCMIKRYGIIKPVLGLSCCMPSNNALYSGVTLRYSRIGTNVFSRYTVRIEMSKESYTDSNDSLRMHATLVTLVLFCSGRKSPVIQLISLASKQLSSVSCGHNFSDTSNSRVVQLYSVDNRQLRSLAPVHSSGHCFIL